MTTVVLHFIAIVSVLIGLALCIIWVKRNGGKELYIVPIVTWLAHSLVFHLYVVAYRLIGSAIWFNPDMISVWSLILRMQMQFSIVSILVMALRERSHGNQLDNGADSLDNLISDRLAWALCVDATTQEG